MDETPDLIKRIEEIEAELLKIDIRQSQLRNELSQLRHQSFIKTSSSQQSLGLEQTNINNQSSQDEKIYLFRFLFKGREDIFSRRFENSKTGKSGYALVCRNEWIPGICHKPKITCRECESRAFVPISDDICRYHLKGSNPNDQAGKDFTIGVYPYYPMKHAGFLQLILINLPGLKMPGLSSKHASGIRFLQVWNDHDLAMAGMSGYSLKPTYQRY
jgi:hypothetical protein